MIHTFTQSSVDKRADELLKHFFTPCTGGVIGIGAIGVAALAAAHHVHKTIKALETARSDRSHIDFYIAVFEKLNYCRYNQYSGEAV